LPRLRPGRPLDQTLVATYSMMSGELLFHCSP
jgi:hypothetical protein